MISFVPSAISVPPKPLCRCDNQCSEKTLSFWQFASVVIKEGEESDTTNLSQQCYNKSLEKKRHKPLTKFQWYEFTTVENVGKRTIHTRNVGIILPRKSKSKNFSGG